MQEKKKIAFILTTFVVGGVEKSFLDMVDCIDREKYDITVFLPDDAGEWTPLLKEKCKVRYLRNEDYKSALLGQLKEGRLLGTLRSLWFRILARLLYKNHYRKSTEYFIRSMPWVRESFDCAVAYQIINDDCVLSTLFRIRASKKVVWSHAYIHKDDPLYGEWYRRFDRIFCVSDFAKRALTENFPALTEKTEVFYNIINPQKIISLSDGDSLELVPDSNVKIVTVGRLSEEKGQDMIPRTARLLKDAGYHFRWYLVGDGPLRDKTEQAIQREGVEKEVLLLGNRNNPYPYMKNCDIYVQSSRSEGWGLTVSEAMVLHRPIVTTDAGVMSEQIRNGVNGIIVPEASPEALAEGIRSLLDDAAKREALSKQLRDEDMSHRDELEKLYRIINE